MSLNHLPNEGPHRSPKQGDLRTSSINVPIPLSPGESFPIIGGRSGVLRLSSAIGRIYGRTYTNYPAVDRANQDGLIVQQSLDGSFRLTVIDGMGGYTGAEKACEVVGQSYISGLQRGLSVKAIQSTLDCDLLLAHLDHGNPATVGAAVATVEVSAGGKVEIRHAGDVKAVIVRPSLDTPLLLQTFDHSRLGNAVRAGMIADRHTTLSLSELREALLSKELTPRQIEIIADRNQIYNCAFIRDGALYTPVKSELTVLDRSLCQNDRIFIASDGIWDNLTVQEVVRFLACDLSLHSPQDSLHTLQRRVNSKVSFKEGKADDCTMLLLIYEGERG